MIVIVKTNIRTWINFCKPHDVWIYEGVASNVLVIEHQHAIWKIMPFSMSLKSRFLLDWCKTLQPRSSLFEAHTFCSWVSSYALCIMHYVCLYQIMHHSACPVLSCLMPMPDIWQSPLSTSLAERHSRHTPWTSCGVPWFVNAFQSRTCYVNESKSKWTMWTSFHPGYLSSHFSWCS